MIRRSSQSGNQQLKQHLLSGLQCRKRLVADILFWDGKQWGRYSTTTEGYDDISYPVAFTDTVFSIIPVDWDTSNITVSRGYTFTVLENNTTLSKCRIASGTGGAGLIQVAFIGR